MRLLKFKDFVLMLMLVAVSLSISSLAFSALALEDDLIYKNALIESSEISKEQTHRVVLSAPKRINNAEFIEKERRINGDKKVMLTKLNSSEALHDAFAYYQSYLADNGQIEFVCEKRACGINSYWANSILEERRVSARDSDQYYVAGQVEKDGVHYWISVYLVTNALRQNFVHVTYIRHESPGQSWDNAYLLFPGSTLPTAIVQSLQKELNADPQLRLYVAAYASLTSTKSVKITQADLNMHYEKMRAYLRESLSIPAERINYQFVGPFHTQPATGKAIWFRLYLLKP